jgi:protein-arginine kinase activator protein McsA
MPFAVGKRALAICDRCGFQVKYLALKEEWNGSRVCPECFETKHPQLEPSGKRADAEALRHARPDRDEPPVSAQDATTYQDFIDSRQF